MDATAQLRGEPASGQLFADRYRLVERLGPARSASVWLGWDDLLGRPMAVKPVSTCSETPSARERALRAARLTGRLQHANVVAIYDIVERDGRTWVVMPFVPSRSLERVLAEGGPLDVPAVARIGADIATALTATHDVGFIHCHVGPEAILITEDGAGRLLGFLDAASVGDSAAARREQSCDIADLGRTLYEAVGAAVGGGGPDARDSGAAATTARASLLRLLDRMCDADPARRPSPSVVRRELSALLAGPASRTSTTRTTGRLRPVDTGAGGRRTPRAPARQPVDTSPGGPPTQSRIPAISSRAIEPVPPIPAEQAPSGVPAHRRPSRRVVVLAAVLVIVLVAAGVGAAALLHAPTAGRGHSTPSASAPAGPRPAAGGGAGSGWKGWTPPPGAAVRVAPGRTPTDAQLAAAVTDYYRLLPRDVSDGWRLLTASYRRTTAGGWPGYRAFWSGVRDVTASRVVGYNGVTAQAVVRYRMADGRRIRELTQFTLAPEHGTLKIAATNVISSVTH